jgi:hypothetical protein
VAAVAAVEARVLLGLMAAAVAQALSSLNILTAAQFQTPAAV